MLVLFYTADRCYVISYLSKRLNVLDFLHFVLADVFFAYVYHLSFEPDFRAYLAFCIKFRFCAISGILGYSLTPTPRVCTLVVV